MSEHREAYVLAQFDLLASLIEAGGKVCHETTTAGGGSMCAVHKHRWPCPTIWQVSRGELVRALRQLRIEHDEAADTQQDFGEGSAQAEATVSAPGPSPETAHREQVCPGCATDGSNAMGLHGHLPDCIYNPMREAHTDKEPTS